MSKGQKDEGREYPAGTIPSGGAPFATKVEAQGAIDERGLNDPMRLTYHEPYEVEGGWAIRKAQYLRGVFGSKSVNPLDTNQVKLGAFGNVLTVEREKEVTLPLAYWHSAKDGVQVHYSQRESEGRRVESKTQTYPFQIFGPGREEDYLNMLRKGTDEIKARYGLE